MPVRKVFSSGKNIIGRFPSLKMGRMISFESLIERDYLYLLDFEKEVQTFEEQPLHIPYQPENKERIYTPDFYVLRAGRSLLIECKPQRFVHTSENTAKFTAVRQWCASRGWVFRVVTDEQLRANWRLSNVRLLTRCARYPVNAATKGRVYAALAAASSLTIAAVMAEVSPHAPTSVFIPILHMAFHDPRRMICE